MTSKVVFFNKNVCDKNYVIVLNILKLFHLLTWRRSFKLSFWRKYIAPWGLIPGLSDCPGLSVEFFAFYGVITQSVIDQSFLKTPVRGASLSPGLSVCDSVETKDNALFLRLYTFSFLVLRYSFFQIKGKSNVSSLEKSRKISLKKKISFKNWCMLQLTSTYCRECITE